MPQYCSHSVLNIICIWCKYQHKHTSLNIMYSIHTATNQKFVLRSYQSPYNKSI